MLKQPLFGQDSSPHKTSSFISAIVTLAGWLLFSIASIFIKFKPQTPKYQEVQIVLSSTPVVEKDSTEDSQQAAAEAAEATEDFAVPEPVEGPSEKVPDLPKPVETPVAKAKVEAPKKTPAPAKPKTQPAATTDPSKKVNFDDYQYANDYSDFDFNSNASASSKKKTFDWSQFDDSASDSENVQVSQKVEKVTSQSSISGSAASTSTANQRQTSSSSSSSSKPTTTNSPSSATSSALSNIKSASYSASTGDSLKAITNAKTSKSSDGQISMQMNDGTTRVLLDPITPAIKLSKEAADLIEGNISVNIEFRVLASGNVPRGEIKISPASVLHEKVRNEIYDQLSTWRFEPGASSASATFEYSIVKR